MAKGRNIISRNNKKGTLIVENDSITNYGGKEFILTILDRLYKKVRKRIDWNKYGMEMEREKYMEEIR